MSVTWSEGTAVAADGVQLHFYDSASQSSVLPILLMLHALLGNSGGLQPAALHFTDEYRVILPDARGHGGSDLYLTGAFTLDNMVSDAVAIIRMVSPSSPVVLIGQSMGASVAARVAKDFPELVTALVLENPPWGSFDPSVCIDMSATATTRLLESVKRLRAMTTEEVATMAETWQLSPLQMGTIEAQLGFDLEVCEETMSAVMADDCQAVVGLLPPSRLQMGGAGRQKEGTQITLDLALQSVATWQQGSLKVFANGSRALHVPPTETEWVEDVSSFLTQHVAGAAAA